ncbi:hypothetical protein [Photobacterium sanguinicancri]|uniref:hypothetical protein n=1 Tax=Photobacterium sanguinicancri TaxID=875932 RepID=UPI003D0AEE0F
MNVIKETKKIIRVIYWYQYTGGLHRPLNGSHFLGATYLISMGGVFIFGIFNYLTAFQVNLVIKYYYVFIGVGFLLGFFIWRYVCLKNNGYKEGEEYFDLIPEKSRKKMGWWMNLLFSGFCFFPYISSLLLGVVVKVIK